MTDDKARQRDQAVAALQAARATFIKICRRPHNVACSSYIGEACNCVHGEADLGWIEATSALREMGEDI